MSLPTEQLAAASTPPLYQSPSQRCILYQGDGYVLSVLTGRVMHEEYKVYFENMLQIMLETGNKAIMHNILDLERSDSISRAWLVTSFAPRMARLIGTDLRLAVVNSRNSVQKAASGFLLKVGQQLGFSQVQFFDSVSEAEGWLLRP